MNGVDFTGALREVPTTNTSFSAEKIHDLSTPFITPEIIIARPNP